MFHARYSSEPIHLLCGVNNRKSACVILIFRVWPRRESFAHVQRAPHFFAYLSLSPSRPLTYPLARYIFSWRKKFSQWNNRKRARSGRSKKRNTRDTRIHVLIANSSWTWSVQERERERENTLWRHKNNWCFSISMVIVIFFLQTCGFTF